MQKSGTVLSVLFWDCWIIGCWSIMEKWIETNFRCIQYIHMASQGFDYCIMMCIKSLFGINVVVLLQTTYCQKKESGTLSWNTRSFL